MDIIVERYYGDENVTKSHFRVESEQGECLLRCECREVMFANYQEAFEGCSKCCLAEGVWECRIKATLLSAMTVSIFRSPGHRSTNILWDERRQAKANTILIGQGDGEPEAEWRRMKNQQEMFGRFERLVYQAYAAGEKIMLRVINPSSMSEA